MAAVCVRLVTSQVLGSVRQMLGKVLGRMLGRKPLPLVGIRPAGLPLPLREYGIEKALSF